MKRGIGSYESQPNRVN